MTDKYPIDCGKGSAQTTGYTVEARYNYNNPKEM